jgi:uncharacterized protein
MDLIGVVHLQPLPGSPNDVGLATALAAAEADARALFDNGADGVIVENFHDVPFFPDQVPPVTVAAMTRAVDRVVALADGKPVGVNVLRNDALAALSIAHACGASFIRVNVHVGAAVTDQGVVQGRAAETLRLKKLLGADVEIWADVSVKHAHPLGSGQISSSEARDAVLRGLADAVIVTGPATGRRIDSDELVMVREALPGTPLVAGSGTTPDNLSRIRGLADAAIVGTWLKHDGQVTNPVDPDRVAALRKAMDRRRSR